jgi:hypothetical protein
MRRLFRNVHRVLAYYFGSEVRHRVYGAKIASLACDPIRSEHAIACLRCFVYMNCVDIPNTVLALVRIKIYSTLRRVI